MSLLELFFGEKREGGYDISTDPPRWLIAGNETTAGISVTTEKVEGLPAVYSAIKILSESVALLPLILYEEQADGGKRRLTNNQLYQVLKNRPSKFTNAFEWRELAMIHMLLRGNFYSQVVRNRAGEVAELTPLDPTRMHPRLVKNQRGEAVIEYRYDLLQGGSVTLNASEILHIKGPTKNGVVGRSPITVAREAFGQMLATQNFNARTFKNGAVPTSVLTTPNSMDDPEALARLRDSWEETYTGSGNANKTVILEEGMDLKTISMTPEDLLFVDQLNLQAHDVARIFRIPPTKMGLLDRAIMSNVEQLALDFLTDSLLPWLTRIEMAITTQLVPGKKAVFAEFVVQGILRADIDTRFKSYNTGVTTGFMSRNEVRILENLNPVDGLDEFLVPLNMGGDSDDPEEGDPGDVREARRMAGIFYPVLFDRMKRTRTRFEKQLIAERKKYGDKFNAENYSNRCVEFLRDSLSATFTAFGSSINLSAGDTSKLLESWLSKTAQAFRDSAATGGKLPAVQDLTGEIINAGLSYGKAN